MLTIRFLRKGKKNQSFFKIVVTDKKNPPRGGRFLEVLGFFNPLTKEKRLKAERIKHWLKVGAKPSDRVYNLLIEEKVVEGKKRDVHKKSKKQKEPAEKPVVSAEPAAEKKEVPQETPKQETPKQEAKKEEVKEEKE